MDARFHNQGFVAKPALNTLKNLCNTVHVGGAGSTSGCADTTLRLDFPGSSVSTGLSASRGIKRKWNLSGGSVEQQIELPLCLGLGRCSSSSDSKGSSATACTTVSSAKETDEGSSMELELDFSLHLGNEKASSPKNCVSSNLTAPVMRPKVNLDLSLSFKPSESDLSTNPCISPCQHVVENTLTIGGTNHKDEGSASPHWKRRNYVPPSLFLEQSLKELKAAPTPDLSSSIVTTPKSSVTCTSGITQQRSSNTKICQFQGCEKGARGASGLCIAHGGGRRCQRPGCHKGAEGRTAYCKAHGGGRRCEFLGCTKSAEGRTDYCIAHGGGRRCSQEGCSRAARGKSGLCIRHGGGKRCTRENCTKSAEGLSGLCISHGGGRRCQYPACTKGAQGSTMFCKAHGGGKRCTFEGCTKGAEGSTPYCKGHGGGKRCAFEGGGVCPKSVHGGTLFCVAHGGGKRCAVPECTKSARGRTDYCVRHGGGKRCKVEGCSKSAQGSTDFCKAHGGGKRCFWGHQDSEFGKDDSPCNAFARGKNGLCTSHSGLVQDKRVHGGATVGVIVQDSKFSEMTKEVINHEDNTADYMMMDNTVVPTTGCISSMWKEGSLSVSLGTTSSPVVVPEGRVHGGGLLALLSGSSEQMLNGNNNFVVGHPSEPGKYYMMPTKWV
ncbi:Transcription factor [Heracleum sosnowskyi]|uniref:Transcription factor n=1 Tax=Heracleum sosnowskyi TaxID=360622 RepID=A0AAD8I0Z9_9APIA|nr:Transcription factor [Heracleum sosnowskyi]